MSPAPVTIEADVVVIGGGIAGISTALHLERAGIDALLVESSELARGASGRNAGYLMRGAAENYDACARRFGAERARKLWELTEANVRALREEGAERLESFREAPSCLVAFEEQEADEIQRSAELLDRHGFDVEVVREGTDALWSWGRAIVGLVNPHDGACNPAELLSMLAHKLDRAPLTGEPALAIERGSDGVVVRTPSYALRAPRAVICTNALAPALAPELAGLIEPNRAQMLAIESGGATLQRSYYANRGGEYFRQPDERTIVVGGWRRFFAEEERTTSQQVSSGVQSGIEGFVRDVLGIDEPRVMARWAGTMAFTPDHLPIAGPIDGSPERVWFCGGFSGQGMSMAFEVSRRMVSRMLGNAPDASDPGFELERFEGVAAID